eukprot:1805413-Alexandrium_andersonii.AAC.1
MPYTGPKQLGIGAATQFRTLRRSLLAPAPILASSPLNIVFRPSEVITGIVPSEQYEELARHVGWGL